MANVERSTNTNGMSFLKNIERMTDLFNDRVILRNFCRCLRSVQI